MTNTNRIILTLAVISTIAFIQCNSTSTPKSFSSGINLLDENRYKDHILTVLNLDKEKGEKLYEIPEDAKPYQIAWIYKGYCNDLRRIDLSSCPPDFIVAFRHHVEAWESYQLAIEALPEGFSEQLSDFLSGNSSAKEENIKEAQEMVRDTYMEVEKIAAEYGAILLDPNNE